MNKIERIEEVYKKLPVGSRVKLKSKLVHYKNVTFFEEDVGTVTKWDYYRDTRRIWIKWDRFDYDNLKNDKWCLDGHPIVGGNYHFFNLSFDESNIVKEILMDDLFEV